MSSTVPRKDSREESKHLNCLLRELEATSVCSDQYLVKDWMLETTFSTRRLNPQSIALISVIFTMSSQKISTSVTEKNWKPSKN
jgi:hypothetical protein